MFLWQRHVIRSEFFRAVLPCPGGEPFPEDSPRVPDNFTAPHLVPAIGETSPKPSQLA